MKIRLKWCWRRRGTGAFLRFRMWFLVFDGFRVQQALQWQGFPLQLFHFEKDCKFRCFGVEVVSDRSLAGGLGGLNPKP